MLDDLLAGQGAKALVVLARSSRDPALAPFAGSARLGASALIAAAGQPPLLAYFSPMEREEAARSGLSLLTPEALDIPRWQRDGAGPVELWHGVLEQALQRAGLGPGRVALAGHLDAGLAVSVCARLADDGWSFVAGEALVLRLRKRKSAAETEEMRRVAAGTAEAFRAVAAALAAAEPGGDRTLAAGGRPLTVGRLRARIAEVLARRGLEQPEGNLVAPAEEGAVPHTQGEDRRALRASESLIVDLFPRGRMFADCTRTFCVGPPPEALARGHADVLAALELASCRARPGVRGWDLQVAVCELLAARGHATPITDSGTVEGYVHGLGHGVGFEVHEQPSFRQHAGDGEGVLEAGDVFTLEPGLYQPEAGWAVRLEDTVVLDGDGRLEVLTELPYALDPALW